MRISLSSGREQPFVCSEESFGHDALGISLENSGFPRLSRKAKEELSDETPIFIIRCELKAHEPLSRILPVDERNHHSWLSMQLRHRILDRSLRRIPSAHELAFTYRVHDLKARNRVVVSK